MLTPQGSSLHEDDARIFVELDITKPLLSKFHIDQQIFRFKQEGLHLICFSCGMHGHGAKKMSAILSISVAGQDANTRMVDVGRQQVAAQDSKAQMIANGRQTARPTDHG